MNAGHSVLVADRRPLPTALARETVDYVAGDIGDPVFVRGLFSREQIDAVFHFAADKANDQSLRQPLAYFRNNVAATLVLLEGMVTVGVRFLVFSSSCAVYGPPDAVPVTELTPLRPASPYAESKLMVERFLRWLDHTAEVHSVSLRYFNAAGASLDGRLGEDDPAPGNLVPRVMNAALRKSPPLPIYGTDYPTADGTAVRDYVHVLDVAAAHLRALEYLAGGGTSDVFNIGSGRGTSVLELVHAAERVTGGPVPVVPASRRPADISEIWADTSKAQGTLDWKPTYTLDDVLRTAWRWHAQPNASDAPEA